MDCKFVLANGHVDFPLPPKGKKAEEYPEIVQYGVPDFVVAVMGSGLSLATKSTRSGPRNGCRARSWNGEETESRGCKFVIIMVIRGLLQWCSVVLCVVAICMVAVVSVSVKKKRLLFVS